jgi:hypothetical protein
MIGTERHEIPGEKVTNHGRLGQKMGKNWAMVTWEGPATVMPIVADDMSCRRPEGH